MSKQLQFSVIITTYNRCHYVLEAVESVLQQTYSAHEIIVVSDGSTDGTGERLRREYSEKHPHVVVVEQENAGRSIAINTGIAHAKGEWVAFLDDDDLWHRDKLQAAAEYLNQNPDCLALNNPIWFFAAEDEGPRNYGGFKRDLVAKNLEECHRIVDENDALGSPFDHLPIKGDSYRKLMERTAGVMSATVIERRTAIRVGGFNPSLNSVDDLDFFIKVARLTEWHTIPRYLGFMRLHPHQETATDADNVIRHLALFISVWYGGRAIPGRRLSPAQLQSTLRQYGHIYEWSVRNAFWTMLKHFGWPHALQASRMGRLLLPDTKRYWRTFLHPTLIHYYSVWTQKRKGKAI